MTRDLHRNFAEQSIQNLSAHPTGHYLTVFGENVRIRSSITRSESISGISIKQNMRTIWTIMSSSTRTDGALPELGLIDFYIDEGATAPNMESAPEWCRLLRDCFRGNVNLIITQKVSNVSKKDYEITFLARILAALEKPVGIYFVSEDIFTMASCYQDTLHDWGMFPDHWSVLPDSISEESLLLTGEHSDA